MSKREELLRKIIDMSDEELDQVSIEFSKPEKKLEPTDWTGNYYKLRSDWFYADKQDDLIDIERRLYLLSVIHNLKHALGDKHKFKPGKYNWFVYFEPSKKSWDVTWGIEVDSNLIYFSTKENSQKVADFLNEHYPNGWTY